MKDEAGSRSGSARSVGGGRYDGLVERFTGEKVPATGISIGVSRLSTASRPSASSKAIRRAGPWSCWSWIAIAWPTISAWPSSCATPASAPRCISAGRHEGADEICRQARLALRRHPGRRREGARRGADQGPRAWRHPHLRQGSRRVSEAQAEAQFSVPEAELVSAVKRVLARNAERDPPCARNRRERSGRWKRRPHDHRCLRPRRLRAGRAVDHPAGRHLPRPDRRGVCATAPMSSPISPARSCACGPT